MSYVWIITSFVGLDLDKIQITSISLITALNSIMNTIESVADCTTRKE